MQVVDFTTPMSFIPMKFILASPTLENSWTAVFKPFSLEMWICVMTTTVVCGIVFYYIVRKEASICGMTNPWSLGSTYWNLFGCLTNQGASNVWNPASRVIMGTWFLASLVIVASYSGNLMSFLVHPSESYIPNSMSELAEEVSAGRYSCGTVMNSALDSYFKNSKEGVTYTFGKYMSEHPELSFASAKDSLQLVLKRKRFAYFSTAGIYEATVNDIGKEKFFISQDSLITFYSGIPISKEFPYKKRFNRMLAAFREMGVLDQLRRASLGNVGTSQVRREDGKEAKPLTIEDVLSPILILCFGYSIATICFALELIVGRNQSTKISEKLHQLK